MEIKSKYKVGGLWWDVSLCHMPSDAGGIDLPKQKISIDDRMTQQMKEVTLFHELIHAMNFELDETMTEFLAQGIYQILNDNNMLK